MHTKSHPQNSEIAQAVVDVCPRPSISPRRPWCQGHGDILGRGRTFTTAHDMGRRLSNASPTPWSRVQITVVFVGGNLAGTGIPEYSGDSGVIRGGFRRNMQESGSNAGIYRNLCKIPVNLAKNRSFLTPAKRRFLWKNSSGKNKNPQESWGILDRNEKQGPRNDIPETGKCNLALEWNRKGISLVDLLEKDSGYMHLMDASLWLHDGLQLQSIGEGACLCPTSTSQCLSQALVIRHLVIAQH